MKLGGHLATALLEVIAEIHASKSQEEFKEVIQSGLYQLVPADIHELVTYGVPPEQEFYTVTPGGYSEEERQLFLLHGETHPIVAFYAKHGDQGPVQVTDLVSMQEWRSTPAYSMTNKRLNQHYEMAALVPGVVSSGMVAIGISRSNRAFSREELAVLWHLRPHLGLALKRLLSAARPPLSCSADLLSKALPQLTIREAEVLYWIMEGKRDSEIATILGIARYTAGTHVKNLLGKLGVESRLAAAMQGMRMTQECARRSDMAMIPSNRKPA